MTKKRRKYWIACLTFLTLTSINASTIVEAIATKAGGYDIPVKIMLPDHQTGKSPVFFFVHGGGWNGGTANEVPNAVLPNDASYLCDQMGIIYVGLAYRCKGNNATFALAIEDLEASIAWFMSKAELYNADLTRIGFGGGSAGTTLSSVLAQRYPSCKVYVGREGMYNLVDQDPYLSFFPTEEGKNQYGLITKEQKLKASAYYNLNKKPASALLFHGKDDYLCHYSQSEKYAKKIGEAGGSAQVVLYEKINHTCLNPAYPEVFGISLMKIARFYATEFQMENIDFKMIKTNMKNRLQGMYPSSEIHTDQIVGTWRHKDESIELKKNGKGTLFNSRTKQTNEITFHNHVTSISVLVEGTKNPRIFYLRKNNKMIYESIEDHTRFKSRRIDYRKESNKLK